MTILRLSSPEQDQLLSLLFLRYPSMEWATFARFGWRDTQDGLVLTLVSIDPPQHRDLDNRVGHVKIDESYTLRIALEAEKHPFAVGVIHSHPENYQPIPSPIDDDMDGYYSKYFPGFAPNRPYVSLIVSKIDGKLVISGRVFYRNQWLQLSRTTSHGYHFDTWVGGIRPLPQTASRERTKRLNTAFGEQAAERLRKGTVAVIGAGGTGSAAIEVLVRAGVGRLILVDPDRLAESNLERVHGSFPVHSKQRAFKVAIARDHANAIDSTCEVEALVGSLPQAAIVDAVLGADVILGCTDSQHSRLALSDLALRYLVPAIDCGVILEGDAGKITAQVAQFVRFLPADPCALCRELIVPARIAQELMSQEEREAKRTAAHIARLRGDDANPYWSETPQLNTVGYLTTAAGAIAAGYAIGWLTGRFTPPFSRLQLNLVAPFFDVTNQEQTPRDFCACRRIRGWCDQAIADALISEPKHWDAVRRI